MWASSHTQLCTMKIFTVCHRCVPLRYITKVSHLHSETSCTSPHASLLLIYRLVLALLSDTRMALILQMCILKAPKKEIFDSLTCLNHAEQRARFQFQWCDTQVALFSSSNDCSHSMKDTLHIFLDLEQKRQIRASNQGFMEHSLKMTHQM